MISWITLYGRTTEYCISMLLTQAPEGKQVKSPVLEAEEPFEIVPLKWPLTER